MRVINLLFFLKLIVVSGNPLHKNSVFTSRRLNETFLIKNCDDKRNNDMNVNSNL